VLVVVALGDPSVPVTCWACAAVAALTQTADRPTPSVLFTAFCFMALPPFRFSECLLTRTLIRSIQ